MEVTLPNSQGKHAHISNMLLKQLRIKEITLKEFMTSCAHWGLKTLDDIYFRSLPSRPIAVVEYEKLSWSKRNRLTDDYYEDNPGVLEYYEDKDYAVRTNKDNLWRLQTFKKHIPESDVKAHERLDEKINDIKLKMEDY